MGFLRSIGLPELLIILAIVLLVFGATRLPKLAGSMGKAMREFRKSASGGERASNNEAQTRRSKARKPPA
jgi:sec-independent protein translocase protein TatA